MQQSAELSEFVVERYKYILQQIHTINENVYRFLAIFQTIATALVTAALALFVGYSKWGIKAGTARDGITGLLILITVMAAFTVLMIVVGTASWFDYRREECELVAKYFEPDFRGKPRLRNFYRWYETYIVLFIIAVTVLLWILGEALLMPKIG